MPLITSMAFKAKQGDIPYKYLGVRMNYENQGYLEYSIDQVLSKNAKFAVEFAREGGYVHIRSCYTNKYWVRSSSDEYWIMAKASEPLDDPSAWNCTLFKMDLIDNDKTATFSHVQSGTRVCLPYDNSSRKMCLCIDPSTNTIAISAAIYLDNIVVLPKYIAFKADNGLYFDYATQTFSGNDIGSDTVVNEIIPNRDGNIRIQAKRDHKEGFLSHQIDTSFSVPTGVLPPGVEDTHGLFSVVKMSGKVALRHLADNMFCRRGRPGDDWDQDINVNGVYSLATSIIKEAQFEVVEWVNSRKVQVLEFDLDHSRIYDVTPITSETHTFDNPTNQEQEGSLNLVISTTKTTTWNNSISIKLGVETSFETGIPFIAEGTIKVTAEGSYEHQFGGSTEEQQQVGDTYTVKVPPMKRVLARGMATRATCDVPFTYTQVDYLTDGSITRTTLSDGVFTGVNAYNFYHDVHYEDLQT